MQPACSHTFCRAILSYLNPPDPVERFYTEVRETLASKKEPPKNAWFTAAILSDKIITLELKEEHKERRDQLKSFLFTLTKETVFGIADRKERCWVYLKGADKVPAEEFHTPEGTPWVWIDRAKNHHYALFTYARS